MSGTSAYFQTNDQLALYFRATPVEASKASIIFVHGLGEHIGRYSEAFQAFSEHGYSCFGYDQRGFGRSEGIRSHINVFSDYVEDLAKFVNEIVSPQSTKAVFILGHSMGSIVALVFALRYSTKIQGLLLFSCPIKLGSYLARLGGFLAQGCSVFMPKFTVPNFIDPQSLSNNLTNIQALNTDPYSVNKVTINWLCEFTMARASILNNAQNIMMPVLINHGEADTIATFSGAKDLFSALGTHDKTLYSYPDLKHELLNHCPAERAKVLEQTFSWLKQQCDS